MTATCECPYCGVWDTHYMRAPNPEPPKRRWEPETQNLRTWGGDAALIVVDTGLDRWDERSYTVIRECRSCRKEWGTL